MPELPEVETMRRGILGVIGARIAGVERVRCVCRPILIEPAINRLRRRTEGRRVAAVDRLGKRVVIRLDSGDALVFEPRMTGLLLVAEPPDRDHLRFRVELDRAAIRNLWYWDRRGLGIVRLLSAEQIAEQLGPRFLGPDALSVDTNQLRQCLGHTLREVKVALLDQQRIAGIGNLYASEILHVAGIHPQRRCRELRPGEWPRLQAAIERVLRDAIAHEGSTLSDGTYRNALSQSGSYQNYHRVYDRAGQLCPTCGKTTVVRLVQAQRATFYCPGCQPSLEVRKPPRTVEPSNEKTRSRKSG